MAAIDLFQGFVLIVRLPEAKDIQKQAAGRVPVETFQFRKVAGLKIRELPALWEWILRSVGRMAHVGEKVQGTGTLISEIPGKTAEEKIGEVVFRTKIEEHVVHSYRGITVEAFEKPENMLQHGKPDSPPVHGSGCQVMDHPRPLVGPDHGDMTVDASVFPAGEVGRDLLIFPIESSVSLLELLAAGLEKMVFPGVDEARVEKKFPQGVHLDFGAYGGMRIFRMGHDMAESAVGTEIHVQDGQTAADPPLPHLSPIDHLDIAGHFRNTGVPDFETGNDHPRHQNPFFRRFFHGKACERQIMNVSLDRFLNKRMRKIGEKRRCDPQTGVSRFPLLKTSYFFSVDG